MPGSPVGEAAGREFITLDKFLSRNGIGSSGTLLNRKISAGSVVEVEIVHYIVGAGEVVLEYCLNVSGRKRLGIGIGIILLEGVTKLFHFVGGGNHLVISLCVKHCTRDHAEGHALVYSSTGLGLHGQVFGGKIKVLLYEIPYFRFGRKRLVLGNLGKVLIIEDDISVTLCKFKIEVTPQEAKFRLKPGLVSVGHLAEGPEIAYGLVGLTHSHVQRAPHSKINVYGSGCYR